MSLSATLNNAMSGLAVAQYWLSVSAHNVANANTKGFTRKAVQPEARVVAGQGAGVQAGELARMVDRFLIEEARRHGTQLARSEVLERYHGRVQDFLGEPGESADLSTRIGQLTAALEAFASAPEAGALAADVVNLAQDLSGSINAMAAQIQRLRADADQEIHSAIDQINAELRAIADLNGQIARFHNLGQESPELLDRRDALVNSLAEKLDISTYHREDGAIVVQTGAGQPLVENAARVLVYEPAAHVDHSTAFGPIRIYHLSQIDPATGAPQDASKDAVLVSGGVRATLNAELQNDAIADAAQTITHQLRGGRLLGLLEVRDRILPELDDQIQELAGALRFALNAAHNGGVAWPPPQSLAGARSDLSGFAAATRSGSAVIAVIDAGTGTTLTAFGVDVAAAAGPDDLVAQINAGLGALGSASIGADGGLRIALASAGQGLAISEGTSRVALADAAGRVRDFGFSHYFGLNDLVRLERERASSLGVRPDLQADPSRLARAQLDVARPPLTATFGGPGDNRAAQALADALRGEHAVIARGGLAAQRTSLDGYAAEIIARASLQAQQIRTTFEHERALGETLRSRMAAVSGVNMDEEMARLVQLQKTYSVCARLISITDRMFDELFRTAG